MAKLIAMRRVELTRLALKKFVLKTEIEHVKDNAPQHINV